MSPRGIGATQAIYSSADCVKTKATWKLSQLRRERRGTIPVFPEGTGAHFPLRFACRKVLMMNDVTRILDAIGQGDAGAAAQLLPLVYDELRRLAAERMAQEKPGQTLQPTALVHEAYLRLVGHGEERHWDSRGHFFAAATEAMRRILIDNARRKLSGKHGGGLVNREAGPDDFPVANPRDPLEVMAVHEALDRLAAEVATQG